MNSIEHKLKEIVSDTLGVYQDEISPSSDFISDFGADDLDMVEIAMRIEEEYNIIIPDERIEMVYTFSDWIMMINSILGYSVHVSENTTISKKSSVKAKEKKQKKKPVSNNEPENPPKLDCEILMQAATIDIYRINAFRISGLSINATTREISNQIQKNQMLEKYGGKTDSRKSPFPVVPPPDNDQLRQALHRLRDPETRIIDEFFWFWPHSLDNSVKDSALDALSRNDIKTAESLWINYEVSLTESNVSRHNLAVLSHLLVLEFELNGESLTKEDIKTRDKYWEDTFRRWKLLLEHEGFWSRLTARVRQLDDPRLTTGFVKRFRESLPAAILQINASLAVKAVEARNESEAKRHIDLLHNSGFGQAVVADVLKHITKPLRNRINTLCKSYSDEKYPDKKSELAACKNLLEQTREILHNIDILLPDNSVIKEGAHDEVALAVMFMAISYSNATSDWEGVQPIYETLLKIVIGKSAKKQIENNYAILKTNIEQDQLYNNCFFCEENRADQRSNYEFSMHCNVRSVCVASYADYDEYVTQWDYSTFEVPRCKKCEDLHEGRSGEHKKEYLLEKEKYEIEKQIYANEVKKLKQLNKGFSQRDSLLIVLNLLFALSFILFIVAIPTYWIVTSLFFTVVIITCNLYIIRVFKKRNLPILEERNQQKLIIQKQKKKIHRQKKLLGNSKRSRPLSDYTEFSVVKELLNQGWDHGEKP